MKILTPQEMLYRESEKYKRGCASQIPAIWHNIAINAIEFAQEQAKNLHKPLVSGSVCENCKILQKEIDDLQSQCNAWEHGRP